jgi:hypothetical protein
MTGLNRDARCLIEAAAREASDEPSGADRARVRQLLTLELGVGAAAGAGTVGIGMAKAAKLVALSKLLLPTAVMALAAAGGSYAYRTYIRSERAPVSSAARASEPRRPAGPAHTQPAPRELRPAAAPELSNAEPLAAEPSATRAARSASGTSQPGREAEHGDHPARSANAVDHRTTESPGEAIGSGPNRPASAEGTLDAETRLLRQAHADIRAGKARQALDRLDAYDRRFGHGVLRAEHQAARVLALCQLGQRQEARSEAQAFLERWPSSPLAPRVRAACIGP